MGADEVAAYAALDSDDTCVQRDVRDMVALERCRTRAISATGAFACLKRYILRRIFDAQLRVNGPHAMTSF